MFHLLFAFVLLPLGAIHFLPTIVAALRQGRNTLWIFLLNLFFGWTLIGWIVALIWAFRDEPRWAARYVPYGYPRAGYPRW